MLELIDFSKCIVNPKKSYLGASSPKKCLVYNNEQYMVKFPAAPDPTKTDLSYSNGCLSEYLGCHIFEIAGIPVQKTLLGTYRTTEGKTKLAVACKDMEKPGTILIPFAGLKNQILNTSTNGYSTDLNEIEDVFEKQQLFDRDEISSFFWNIFVVDSLIGNFDRHNGNWGYLYDSLNDSVSLAPVYDCGSALYPQADEKTVNAVLNNEEELKQRVFVFPTSAIKVNGRKLSYHDFLNSFENADCNKAVLTIYPRLDMMKINELFESLSGFVSDKQILFYKTIVKARKEMILEPAYTKLHLKESRPKER